jgi:hypothetical protein
MRTILIALCIVIFLGVVGIGARHLMVQSSDQQKLFLAGTVPDDLPDGVYNGEFPMAIQWKGKRFDAKRGTGVNLFRDGIQAVHEDLIFVMDVGPSLIEREDFQVIKIDYDLAENPWWVRLVVDEIVLVEPGRYLGKVHVKLLPGVRVAVGFFELQQIKEQY